MISCLNLSSFAYFCRIMVYIEIYDIIFGASMMIFQMFSFWCEFNVLWSMHQHPYRVRLVTLRI
jgi:hypothetical protein